MRSAAELRRDILQVIQTPQTSLSRFRAFALSRFRAFGLSRFRAFAIDLLLRF